VRDAHVRDIEAMLLADGCAAFDDATHDTAVAALKPVARIATIAEMLAEITL
jgi:ureidoacrylate peracid hydrolase